MLLQPFAVLVSCELHAALRVVGEPRRRTLTSDTNPIWD